MTNTANELEADMDRLDIAITEKYCQIDESEAATTLYRQQCEQLLRRRATLEAQLQREKALYVKPEGECVQLEAPDGTIWNL